MDSAGFKLSNGNNIHYVPDLYIETWPIVLGEKDKQQIHIQGEKIKKTLKQQTPRVHVKYAWFRSTDGNEYKCKLPRNISKYLKQIE